MFHTRNPAQFDEREIYLLKIPKDFEDEQELSDIYKLELSPMNDAYVDMGRHGSGSYSAFMNVIPTKSMYGTYQRMSNFMEVNLTGIK